jgi:fermentation-respiration switch protein FrsA (DUF1100 family)
MRSGLLGATVLVGLLVVYWAALFVWQRSLLFPAPPVSGAPPRPGDAEVVWIEIGGDSVEAWFLPPLVDARDPAPLLLFTHGNGELIDYWPGAFDEPRRWGLAVLLVEYPGYGRSGGAPSQRSVTGAVLAAFDWARQQSRVDASRIIAYGRSVGGGAATALAGARPVAAMILQSTFTNVAVFARRFGAPGFLVRDRFDNLAVVRQFTRPLLILHGEHDEMIPVSQGKALHAAQPASQLLLMPCGHNDCEPPWAAIEDFLTGHRLLPRNG